MEVPMETPQATNPGEVEKTPLLKPVFVASHEGEARWWGGGLAVIKASAADTGGQMTIVEVTEPPGAEAPLHVHHNEDEAFWVLDGAATFEVGEGTIEAHAGDYAFGPRHIPHRYCVGDAGCRMLFILTPGGFEDLVTAMSEPAGACTLPPPSIEKPDMADIKAIAEAHGVEILDG
jgi:quercetin dioxygenase-like cupin family protein